MSAPWVWNNDYDDLEQVAEFLPAFLTVLADIESAGQYRYNDSFKGRIPGIAGDHEDTGIYLLQGLERKRAQQSKVDDLLAQGYVWLRKVLVPTAPTNEEQS
jgi:hypothetical protein